MIRIEQIKYFFPLPVQDNPVFSQYMLKEYLQLMILEYISTTHFIRRLTFIGGTNLRLLKGINRFSEDLDFDCTDLSQEDFFNLGDSVSNFLRNNGWNVILIKSNKDNLQAFRCNIYFPNLLFDLGLTGHKEMRFLVKLEGQDQGITYPTELADVKGCGFFFPFPVPVNSVLCSMKISAMLNRQKGRDFYDVMFLLSQTKPDLKFLKDKCDINSLTELKKRVFSVLQTTNLENKVRDFEHLTFNKNDARKIIRFGEFIRTIE